MLIIVFDTETTSLPLFKEPSESPGQPHLVELAASIFDTTTGEQVDGFSTLIKPDGWVSEPEALAAHGITHEMAMADGVPEHVALSTFLAMHGRCDMRVAHNQALDQRILRIAIKRYGHGLDGWETLTQEQKDTIADNFKSSPSYCTCNASKPILQLPATDRMKKTGFGRSFKAPKLEEAYQYFFGETFEGAHRAHVDVAACAKVYFALNPVAQVA